MPNVIVAESEAVQPPSTLLKPELQRVPCICYRQEMI